jgi:hypothetical protein
VIQGSLWLQCISLKNIYDMMHKSSVPTEQDVSSNQKLSSGFLCIALFLCNPHYFVL